MAMPPNSLFGPEDGVFVRRLVSWFRRNMRPLPWRTGYSPYHVWISEIMLQQTQMERGVRYFTAWMRRFPDVHAVAQADEDDILAAWEGLGYYSRARNLHAAARVIVARHGGAFPDNLGDIRALPGVGEYTAAAIASIAFSLPVPAVDANVLRIFARLLDCPEPVGGRLLRDRSTAAVQSLLPLASPREFNQALMEFGALVCGKAPRCSECPVRDHCAALRNGTVAERPVKPAKTAPTRINAVAAVLMHDGRVRIRKRPKKGLWPGMWEFAGGEMHQGETPVETVRRIMAEENMTAASDPQPIATVHHGYTTNRVTLHGFLCPVLDRTDGGGDLWALPGEASKLSFSAGHRKLLEKLGWKGRE